MALTNKQTENAFYSSKKYQQNMNAVTYGAKSLINLEEIMKQTPPRDFNQSSADHKFDMRNSLFLNNPFILTYYKKTGLL